MSDLLREYWKSLLGAVLVHALIAALLFVAVNFTHQPKIAGQLAIEAVLESAQPNRNAERERQQREAADKAAQDKLKEEEQAKAEQQKQEQDKAAQEKAAQEKAKQEASRKEQEHQLAVEAEQAEIRKQADIKHQQQADQQKKQQADQQKKQQAEQQQKAEAERQQKAAADKQRLADIQRKQQEEADSRDKAAREAELKRQLAEEEGRSNAVDSGALAQYMSILQQRINNNWNRPLSATSGVQCDIKISQTSNGTVVSAQVTQCNGDAALKQSIEQAVYKSSPLPLPQDSRLFERNLLFRFKPD